MTDVDGRLLLVTRQHPHVDARQQQRSDRLGNLRRTPSKQHSCKIYNVVAKLIYIYDH